MCTLDVALPRRMQCGLKNAIQELETRCWLRLDQTIGSLEDFPRSIEWTKNGNWAKILFNFILRGIRIT
jgi:hypothetical protein